MSLPPVVSFVAPSGTGKTTLLERLIPELRRRGLRVAAVKHDAHRIEIDREGKDTYRMRQAGASPVVISSREGYAAFGDLDGEWPLLDVVARFAGAVDLVLTEGYRRTDLAKVLVHRAARGRDPSWILPDGIFAAATDVPLGLGLPEVPLEDPVPLADLLCDRFGLGASPAVPVPATPVVLVGGASRRMGSDKAWLDLGGRPVLPELLRRLGEATSRPALVVAREGQDLPPVDARIVRDLRPRQGPLGGLLTALAAMDEARAVVVACDQPFVIPELIRVLASRTPTADAVLPERGGRLEPLPGIYAASCVPAVHRAILAGERRMDGFLGAVRVDAVPESDWRAGDPEGVSFLNLNSPEDLRAAEARAAGSPPPPEL